MTNAIEFQNVTSAYRDQPVLHDITLAIAEGEMAAILGPNGAGKTTLFRVLTGLLRPTAGSVKVFGHDVQGLRAAERARLIGVVPQEVDTPVAFTVEEMVLMGRTAALQRWARPDANDRRIVDRAMAYTDVSGIKHRFYAELSGGEKQRTIVAAALAQEPRIILMDEATSHLDINHRFEIMQLVQRLNADQRVTVVLISHDLTLAADFCPRLVILDHGRVAAQGAPAAVLTDELLRGVYHCDIHVQQDPLTGSINIAPARNRVTSHSGRGIRVHIVAGGGAGEDIFRHLTLCGYTLSCGVLNQGDNDATTANALGVAMALERPFSPVGAEALRAAQVLAAQANVIVLSDVPFGPGNVANLQLLEEGLARGCQVLILDGIEQRDYTPSREAVRRVKALLAGGAVACRNIADLVARLPVAPALPHST